MIKGGEVEVINGGEGLKEVTEIDKESEQGQDRDGTKDEGG